MSISLLRRFDGSAAALGAFSPASLAGFAAWYRYDAGPRWQDVGKTTPATTGDLAYWIDPYLGSGASFFSVGDANRFTIASGGLQGDGTRTGYRSGPWNFSAGYSVFWRFRLGDVNALKYFATVYGATLGHAVLIRSNAVPVEFRENQDGEDFDLGGSVPTYVTVGISVTGAGVGTAFKADGSAVAVDGSSGATVHDADSYLTWGGGSDILGVSAATSDRLLTDVYVRTATTTTSEANHLQSFFNSLRP